LDILFENNSRPDDDDDDGVGSDGVTVVTDDGTADAELTLTGDDETGVDSDVKVGVSIVSSVLVSNPSV